MPSVIMPPIKITSVTNPKIKRVIGLRDRRERDQSGLTIIEGRRELELAIQAGVEVKEIYTSGESFQKKGTAPIFFITPGVYAKISYGNREEGILAVAEQPKIDFTDSRLKSGEQIFVVIEQVEKPGNLGAIFRTCDAVGVSGVLVCDPATDLYNPNVIRASLGTIFSVNTMVCSNQEALDFCKSKKIKCLATTPCADQIYYNSDLKCPVAIIVGSEEKGLSDFWMRHADLKVRIPMLGLADSLNVSTSTAVLLYEALRQRNRK